MKTGLCTIALSDKSLPEALDVAKDCGFDGVEIWGKEGHLPPASTDDEICKAKESCDERGLEVITFGSYLRILADDFDSESSAVLNCASALGADMVRIWAAHVPSAKADDNLVQRAASQLKKLADQADDSGLTIILENHDNSLTDNSQMTRKLLAESERSNLRSYWQPSFRGGHEDWYQALENLIPVLGGIHAQNYKGEYKERTQLADGDVDYHKIADILKKNNISCPIFIEFPAPGNPKDTIAKDIRFLQQLFV